MTNRMDRCREYNGKPRGLQGEGRSEKNLEGWSARATANSKIAPRATDKPMELPSTKVTSRPTTMRPVEQRKIDRLMKGDEPSDLNTAGSSYMRGIRRTT
jgi:hypothetical protein